MTAVVTLLVVATMPLPDAHAAERVMPLERPDDVVAVEDVARDELRTHADVINGTPVARGTHAYVALLMFFDPTTDAVTSTCSGSLIDSTHVMTAAHCVDDLRPTVVALNLYRLDDAATAELLVADAVVLPPSAGSAAHNDIALLRLASPAATAPVAVAGEGDDYRFTGRTPATVVGWGLRRTGTTTDQLLQGDMELLSADACHSAFGGVYDAAGMLCAGGQTADACNGDSGGPLLIWDGQWVAIGVTSFGDAACSTGDASAFARVSHARAWLSGYATNLSDRGGSGPFIDVRRDERHFDAVLAISRKGIAMGTSDRTYQPNRVVTRAQMASFVARAVGLSSSRPPQFRDVPADHAHAGAIAAVAAAGITTGYADGTFRPAEHITRGQMASFLTRAFALASPPRSPFTDVRADVVHARAISAVAAAGITTGFSDGTFRPQRKVTRGEMASFLARALKLLTLTPTR